MSAVLVRLKWSCAACDGLLPKGLNAQGYPHGEVRRITGWKPGDRAMKMCNCADRRTEGGKV